MRQLLLSFGRTFRLVLIAVIACASSPTVADDVTDCESFVDDRRIAGCTKMIDQHAQPKEGRVRAHANRGRGYFNKTMKDRAAADFAAAAQLEIRPAYVALYKGLNDVALDNSTAAIQKFAEAIKLDPQLADAYTARGNTLRTKGDYELAIADLDMAIKLNPSLALAYSNRGRVHGSRSEHDLAVADFDKAIALKAEFPSALRYRALAKYELRQLDPALADVEAALRLEPRSAFAVNMRGLIYSKKGDKVRALAEYSEAIRIDPQYAIAYSNRAAVNSSRGNIDLAIADYEKVLAIPASSKAERERHELTRERLSRLQDRKRAAPPAPPVKHLRVALVIGNGKYQQAGLLANPANDAQSLAKALTRLGFSKVIEVYDANREQMAKALKDFGDHAEGAEWAVVFFAGHGIEVNGATYLIPTDAQLKRDTHIEDEALSLARVQAKVDAASKLGLVILDSCRNNPFLSRMTRSAGATRALAQGLAPVEPDGNVLVFYAAKHGTVAEDGKGEHSPFTEALLAHIEEPGLEINFLLRKVRDAVRRKTDRRQEPFHYGSLSSEPLYFKLATAR